MMQSFTQFAAGDILGALGIDWQMLIFQIIGFVILVWIMAKFVYPPMIKTIDARQERIEASNQAAREAEEKANAASEEIAKLMKEARVEASNIVATAKDEANNMLIEAEEKSESQAERIISAAHENIAKEVEAAKKALHNETVDLVQLATTKIVGDSIDKKADSKIIEQALKESA